MSSHLQVTAIVAFGGAFGAISRYWLNLLAVSLLGPGFPYGTLLVNVLGSLAIGVVYALVEHGIIASMPWRALIGVGFLGALTTFSTFSMDTLTLLHSGAFGQALANVLLNVLLCLIAVWFGQLLVVSRLT